MADPVAARHPGARRLLGLLLAGAALAASAPAAAAPLGHVLNTNQTIDLVDLASNADAPAGSTGFPSNSLAVNPAGQLFSADPAGVIWNVTGGPFPVGPTGRTQIGDLDWAPGGLWGYSNASQELFFFSFGSTSVTYAAVLTLPASLSANAEVTGVAFQPGSGDVFLAVRFGLNNDSLLQVPSASTTALMVGPMAHLDSFSFISDIDFDAAGTLWAMTWFHRHFYTVATGTAATSFVSAGPHRDTTGLALAPIPEPASGWLMGLGAAALALRLRRAR